MCTYVTMGRNAKYQKNQKNGGTIPAILDERALHVPRPCGKCKQCREQKAREWQIRLMEDIKKHKNGKMIVLTLSNESYTELNNITPTWKRHPRKKDEIIPIEGYTRDNEIMKLAVKRFRERWRKKFGKSPRHWFITELGHQGTENIHIHGIIWTDKKFSDIRERWNYGYIYPRKDEERHNYVSNRTIAYNIKYVHKMDKQHKYYNSIVLTSPGIGANFINSMNRELNRYNGKDTVLTYTTTDGYKMQLPVYYKRKIYNDSVREAIWMHTLDQPYVYIDGIKIDRRNKKAQKNILKSAQDKSKELGYGSNKTDFKRKKYENERRKLIQQARMIIKKRNKYKRLAGGAVKQKGLDI